MLLTPKALISHCACRYLVMMIYEVGWAVITPDFSRLFSHGIIQMSYSKEPDSSVSCGCLVLGRQADDTWCML